MAGGICTGPAVNWTEKLTEGLTHQIHPDVLRSRRLPRSQVVDADHVSVVARTDGGNAVADPGARPAVL
jgi:hypothetical protein